MVLKTDVDFGESLQSKLSSGLLMLLHTSIVHLIFEVRARFSISDLRLLSDWEIVPPSYDLQYSGN